MSEALIFASTNPQYDDRLFIELQVQYMKIPSSSLGRTCCVQKLFPTFRTIFVHNMFSPCSAKRRASEKDLPVTTFNTDQKRKLSLFHIFYQVIKETIKNCRFIFQSQSKISWSTLSKRNKQVDQWPNVHLGFNATSET